VRYYGFDWVGTVLGLASIYCLGRRQRVGFLLRILASGFWVAFGIVAGTPAAVVANAAAIVLSANALRAWARK